MVLPEPIEATKTKITADALWQMGSIAEKYELVKGDLVEMTPPGGVHGQLAVRLVVLLQNFVYANKLGEILVESGYILATNPDTVRGPDISFLSTEKIPSAGIPTGYIKGVPDLVVEIVSPSDTASIMQAKVEDYLTYGTQLVWVIYPRRKTVMIHHPDGTAHTLHQDDTLSGEGVLPGFSCFVNDIF